MLDIVHSPFRTLLAAQPPGHSLAQAFYADPAIFMRDMALLLGRWSYAGHASEVREPGAWLTAELGAESAIVVRGRDGVLRAFANVCRHRGSRICVRPRGRGPTLVCPYHAWAYDLDGGLRAAAQMPDNFDPVAHALWPLKLAEIGGLLFLAFGPSPPEIAAAMAALLAFTDRFGWAEARVAARRHYSVAANWKLVLENYHECYHCAPAHPEFAALHALARPGNRRIGDEDREGWGPVADGCEPFRVMHSMLAEKLATGSRDGRTLAPLMGPAFDGRCVFAELGLLSAFLAYPDHGVIYRFIPRAVQKTAMEVIWLVRGDAVAGQDYDEDALVWLWDVTSAADKRIIERNQAGVNSRFYAPGPFSLMETGTQQYVARYLSEIARFEAGDGV